ncbi:MAG: phenylalanine--tRNA ligase subunit alpha [Rickettsiales bacterium]|jgi:phenylalanyl-tRNA synthetase alpha chain|nr:phenylalanine--tRNA ligase subunit alpha [Rickettsiales bacterium]
MEKIKSIKASFLEKARDVSSTENIKEIKSFFLGKNSDINGVFKDLVSLAEEEKKLIGVEVNNLRSFITDKLKLLEDEIIRAKIEEELKKETLDITLPVREDVNGFIHPVSFVIKELADIAVSMGFSIARDSEVENDWFCFESLNIPKHHPARQMQDTFYLRDSDNGEKIVLRTQTTSIQVKEMKGKLPPFKFINYGKTFRSEMDATHSPMFHQMDFVYVDRGVTMQDLKDFLVTFIKKFFSLNTVPLRFRPSYFPFTSPSMEVDIKCKKDGGRIIIGEGNNWLEILGSGMIHQNVLINAGIDSEEYQGFALAFGVERMAMLKYGIRDIRNLYEGDIRFLKAYGFRVFE